MKDTDKDTEAPSTTTAKPSARWGQDRRLAFIDFRLQWDGRLNRSDLMDFFGISMPQASLDIARYTERAPSNLTYDRSSRVYQTAPTFEPLHPGTSPQRYLNELLVTTTGILEPDASFIGWRPPTDSVPQPGRSVAAGILAALLKAMREERALRVLYQSMSRPEPSSRVIAPHAFAYDGFRWHVRAFCHSREKYLDFVLGRFLEIQGEEATDATSQDDQEWNTVLTLVLAPHPDLTAGKKRAIELDYGMTNGEVELKCRQSLLYYTLKRLGLNQRGTSQPESQQIVLKNEAELAPLLQAASNNN